MAKNQSKPKNPPERPSFGLGGGHFKNQMITLDFLSFRDCVFEECTIVFNGFGAISLIGCEFRNCAYEMGGAAANTIDFLTSMYHGVEGGKELIELTFANIRNGRV